MALFKTPESQNPEFELLFSREIETKLASGELSMPSVAYRYTFIGNYADAVGTYDIPVFWGIDTMKIPEGTKLANAVDAILKEAQNHRIIIISESHLKPQHRIFSKNLIVGLKDSPLGFDLLGLEALAPDSENTFQLKDNLLNERGFALHSWKTGHYVNEPQMAQFIRTALRNDYKLFAYEREKKVDDKDRDEIQADNIIRIMKANPNAKIVINCGWHHVIESDELKYGKYFWMAKHIKEKTGIDPLTIYQDNFTEKIIYNEHPVLKTLSITEPSVFVDENDKIMRFSEHVDVEVVHPKTSYINGRPNWLIQNEDCRYYSLDHEKIDIDYPLFAKAYLLEEYEIGVPIDIIEIKHEFDRKPLVLEKGRYKLHITNKSEELALEIVVE